MQKKRINRSDTSYIMAKKRKYIIQHYHIHPYHTPILTIPYKHPYIFIKDVSVLAHWNSPFTQRPQPGFPNFHRQPILPVDSQQDACCREREVERHRVLRLVVFLHGGFWWDFGRKKNIAPIVTKHNKVHKPETLIVDYCRPSVKLRVALDAWTLNHSMFLSLEKQGDKDDKVR